MRLSDPLTEHLRLMDSQKSALSRLNVHTVHDLLFHFPFRYDTAGDESTISGLVAGQEATVIGTIDKLETKKSWKRRIPISEGFIQDASGKIKCMWFNQPYIAKMYQNGTLVKAVGKVSGSGAKMYLANPQLEKVSATDEGLFIQTEEKPEGDPSTFSKSSVAKGFFAQYPESRGVTSLWMRHAVQKVLPNVIEEIEDPIPADILKRYNLPTLKTALVWIHTPQNLKDADAARKRFAFEEVFFIQLERQRERAAQAKEKSFTVDAPPAAVDEFMSAFPFTATVAQNRAINAILKDMQSGHPMSRLLEGDVGSGKTAVAATASYAAVRTRPQGQTFGTLQVAYMAPTEILAKQHFESFIKYFENFPINIGLITGSGCYKFPSKVRRGQATNISRTQLLKWVANGEIPVVIGTHALIQKSVQFKHLALVIIDEQHRFGTNQRRQLAKKEVRLPHLLSMTATPIPRTLALTIYGDLDLTLLDEMPPGRKPIITELVKPEERGDAYQLMRRELKDGRQAYVICPRIDEPDPDKAFALQAKSVKAEAKRLKKEVFPEYSIGILHSKMKPAEKDNIMAQFSNKEIDILVATSVVEVGVNVPNATMIFIEGAERFGLSQLHQLRGRVVRSTHQAYCFVCPESRGEKTLDRLKALKKAKNGFELAEMDLMQRGPGELSGRQQWGISDIGMEALKNLKLVEAARTEAVTLIQKEPELQKHPALLAALLRRTQTTHFE
ncbi:MAG: ATP-dependent DNA helicase RecG [Candidatus Pacebacteria bacterium]|nr:ATP-dependent DNA helicase RecG [Candidatus Paceibacterota bacterium]